MRVLTFKANPKTIFGIVLAITGIIVIILSFAGNHSEKTEPPSAAIGCANTQERVKYLNSVGWETDGNENKKQIIIPSKFNDVYTRYNDIQKKQGFDLEQYKGKKATIYTYSITNYKSNNNVVADLIVYDGKLIGADLCDPSADSGFLTALSGKD